MKFNPLPKKISLLLLLCFIANYWASAQNQTETKNVMVADEIAPFNDAFSKIIIGGKTKYLHSSGKIWVDEVIETNYGLAVVTKNDAYGALNEKGEVIADFKYDEVKILVDYNLFNNKQVYYKFIRVKLNGKYGAIYGDGKEICAAVYEEIEGLNAEVLAVKKNGLWGMRSLPEGKEIVAPAYNSLQKFYNWPGGVQIEKNNKKGIALNDGTIRLKPTYDYLYDLIISNKVYFKFEIGQQYGLMNAAGKQIIAAQYQNLDPIPRTEILKVKKNNLYGLISLSGVPLLAPKFTSINEFVQNRMIVSNGKMGVINLNGTEIIKPLYNRIDIVNAQNDLVYSDNLRPVELIAPSSEKKLTPQAETLPLYFLVTLNHKQGVINWDGKEIVPVQYDRIELQYALNSTWFKVRQGKKAGLLNLHGKQEIALEYDRLQKEFNAYNYDDAPLKDQKDNYVLLQQNKKIGLYSLALHKIIVPVKHYRIAWENYGFINAQVSDTAANAEAYETLNALLKADGTLVRNYEKHGTYFPVDSDRIVETKYQNGYYTSTLTNLKGEQIYENKFWKFDAGKFNSLLIDEDKDPGYHQAAYKNGLLKIRGKEENLFITQEGKETRFEKYNYVGDFWHGLAVVEVKTEAGLRYGIIDTAGKEVLPATNNRIDDLYNHKNILKIKNDGGLGIITKDAKLVLPAQYSTIEIPYNKKFFILNKNGLQGLAHLNGNIFVPIIYGLLKMNYGYEADIWPILVQEGEWFTYLTAAGKYLPIKSKKSSPHY